MCPEKNACAGQVPTEKPTEKPTKPLSDVETISAAVLDDTNPDLLKMSRPFDNVQPNRCNCKNDLDGPLVCGTCEWVFLPQGDCAEEEPVEPWLVLTTDDGYDSDPEL